LLPDVESKADVTGFMGRVRTGDISRIQQ